MSTILKRRGPSQEREAEAKRQKTLESQQQNPDTGLIQSVQQRTKSPEPIASLLNDFETRETTPSPQDDETPPPTESPSPERQEPKVSKRPNLPLVPKKGKIKISSIPSKRRA